MSQHSNDVVERTSEELVILLAFHLIKNVKSPWGQGGGGSSNVKTAWRTFSHSTRKLVTFPNCFSWKGRIGRRAFPAPFFLGDTKDGTDWPQSKKANEKLNHHSI
jgi:hypothetical protein